MIIEIKDIPHNKTIKHINIDITFDDNDEKNISNLDDKKLNYQKQHQIKTEINSDNKESEQRISKPISEEMQNIEF
jgi:hypothetical protein